MPWPVGPGTLRAESAHLAGPRASRTARVWDELARLGCDFAQGYYLRRPLPAEKLTRKLGMIPVDADSAADRPPLRLVSGC